MIDIRKEPSMDEVNLQLDYMRALLDTMAMQYFESHEDVIWSDEIGALLNNHSAAREYCRSYRNINDLVFMLLGHTNGLLDLVKASQHAQMAECRNCENHLSPVSLHIGRLYDKADAEMQNTVKKLLHQPEKPSGEVVAGYAARRG